jgi:hypothetical protein
MQAKLSFAELRQITLDGIWFYRNAETSVQSSASRHAFNQLAQAKQAMLAILDGKVSVSALTESESSEACYLAHEEYRVLAALIKGRPWKLPLRELRHIESWVLETLESRFNDVDAPAQQRALKLYASRIAAALSEFEEAHDFNVPGVYRVPTRASSYII